MKLKVQKPYLLSKVATISFSKMKLIFCVAFLKIISYLSYNQNKIKKTEIILIILYIFQRFGQEINKNLKHKSYKI